LANKGGLLVRLTQQISDFGWLRVLELLPAPLERFVKLNGRILHLLMGVSGAADKNEMIGGGQAAMAIAIKGDAQKSNYFFFGRATLSLHGEIAPHR
jgi:hypothetical protein